jgi:hypothetical protein
VVPLALKARKSLKSSPSRRASVTPRNRPKRIHIAHGRMANESAGPEGGIELQRARSRHRFR